MSSDTNLDGNYVPPKVWEWNPENVGNLSVVNRPFSGATHEKVLPVGERTLQLYSMSTPNGQKVAIMLEELLAQGVSHAEYDAHLINIRKGEQLSSGFIEINPNSKTPALMDHDTTPPTRVFESGSILQYLADKFDALVPKDHAGKTECRNWLFWQMGCAPYLGGGFGHFYFYSSVRMKYPVDRFTIEVKRELDVLDKHLAKNLYMAGDEYSIADIAIWPWYGSLVLGNLYEAAEFLDVASYTNLIRWAKEIEQRPAVQRGIDVNRL